MSNFTKPSWKRIALLRLDAKEAGSPFDPARTRQTRVVFRSFDSPARGPTVTKGGKTTPFAARMPGSRFMTFETMYNGRSLDSSYTEARYAPTSPIAVK